MWAVYLNSSFFISFTQRNARQEVESQNVSLVPAYFGCIVVASLECRNTW